MNEQFSNNIQNHFTALRYLPLTAHFTNVRYSLSSFLSNTHTAGNHHTILYRKSNKKYILLKLSAEFTRHKEGTKIKAKIKPFLNGKYLLTIEK